MDATRERQLPTAQLLLDVRTPAELAVSPDGTAIAFALHATVADEGSFVPSDLYVVGTGPSDVAGRAHRWSVVRSAPRSGRPTARDSRSCRTGCTPGHQLPYTMAAAGR